MKRLTTLFVLFTLALMAAKPVNPTLTVNCDGGVGGGCSQPHFYATNIDPAATYEIDGTGVDPVTGAIKESLSWFPDPNINYVGTSIDMPNGGVLDSGSWTFELHKIGNSGKEMNKVLSLYTATY